MNFWEVFSRLCEEHGESATTVITKLGLSKGNAARWKNGGGTTLTTMIKISKYFNVPISDIIPANDTTP